MAWLSRSSLSPAPLYLPMGGGDPCVHKNNTRPWCLRPCRRGPRSTGVIWPGAVGREEPLSAGESAGGGCGATRRGSGWPGLVLHVQGAGEQGPCRGRAGGGSRAAPPASCPIPPSLCRVRDDAGPPSGRRPCAGGADKACGGEAGRAVGMDTGGRAARLLPHVIGPCAAAGRCAGLASWRPAATAHAPSKPYDGAARPAARARNGPARGLGGAHGGAASRSAPRRRRCLAAPTA